MEPVFVSGHPLRLRCGELVEVRSEAEIARTLDSNHCLDGLPFMEEMRRFCGRHFRVRKRADRVCVEGAPAMMALGEAVLLDDLRCDGRSHGGCGRGCMLLWKEEWLRRAIGPSFSTRARSLPWAVPAVVPFAFPVEERHAAGPWRCQSTELIRASEPLPWWRVGQYVDDLASGNHTPLSLAHTALVTTLVRIRRVAGRRKAKPLDGSAATSVVPEVLGLRPGECVRVRSWDEIARTLDDKGRNRGLEFAAGMETWCGKRLRVERVVDRIILETTGAMKTLRNTVVLEGALCDGTCERGCPRSNPLFWREAWLKRE